MPRLFPKSFKKQLKNFLILARDYGQYRTIKGRSIVDARGRPIPWYTYPAIEYLNSFDFRRCEVFEFGSGYSSLYWADRAARVVSVEDHAEWHRQVQSMRRENQDLILAEGATDYIGALARQNRTFDIVVVDGSHRKRCAEAALDHLAPQGMIVLDNSDGLPNTTAMLRKAGFFQIDFSGFGPHNAYCWTTSLFVKEGQRLQAGYRNPVPTGGNTRQSPNDF